MFTFYFSNFFFQLFNMELHLIIIKKITKFTAENIDTAHLKNMIAF